MIVGNPLAGLAYKLRRSSPQEKPDAKRDHDTLAALGDAVLGILTRGEWHEETVAAAAPTVIPHRLGYRPTDYIVTRRSAGQAVYVPDYEQWNDRQVVLQTITGPQDVRFVLF